ncbi:hypothetical protein NI401_09645 [Acinetobacter indicus]|uniref:hypothetical protein n=1 Tax=Acinetobacter indicus TaxID=756892 RepID=UPI00209B3372|nr:hypothetical protein [Acinetobacter indicus]MCO8103160.1 hypothetical protein [Acinetobacter indicus]
MHEWRKQLVEKLLLNGVKAEDLEKHVNAAEMAIYGNQIATVTIECPFKFAAELKAILHDFSQKNGCRVMATTSS